MLKRVITAAAALIMAASISATALAAPATTDNPYLTKLKTIKTDVNALRKTLATERTTDRNLMRDIQKLKNRAKIDKTQLLAYQAEMKPLQTEYKALAVKLKEAAKTKDAAAIAKAKADLAAMKQKIAAVKGEVPGSGEGPGNQKDRVQRRENAQGAASAQVQSASPAGIQIHLPLPQARLPDDTAESCGEGRE